MARYLITQSLLSSWAYMFNAWDGGKDEAYESFLQTLKREKTKQTEAMLNGIAFEEACYKAARGEERFNEGAWESGVTAISEIIAGAPTQIKAQRDITVDGIDYLVYGILDAMKAGVIYDVKFVNKSFGSTDLVGKYLDSAQHPAYFYIVPEARRFEYLVSDGKDLYVEGYDREDTRDIGEIIREFRRSVQGMGLDNLYKEMWGTK